MKRRTFVGFVAAGAAAAVAGVSWLWTHLGSESSGDAGGARSPRGTGRSVFPERFKASLEAMCDRLVPEGPDGVGARSTQAFSYIERELQLAEMASMQLFLTRGAAQLDRVSHGEHGVLFTRATPEQQDSVIAAMQRGVGAAPRFDPPEFVRAMVGLTLEGMFSDPCHGGNAERKGWQLIGYAMHPPTAACH